GHATPVYPASGDLNSPSIARAVHQSLDSLLPSVPERYREDYRKKCQILSRREALEWIHRPANQEQIDQARRTLIYDELFLMELGVGLKREHARHTLHSVPMKVDEILDKRIRRLFPFDLTDDQNKVITEVCADMARPRPMNRLLQGDVGSGKTVVALYAALLAVGHHKQVAIMAPTEILAEQHFLAIDKFLIDSKVKHVLIKGGITGKQRAEVLQQIKEGEFGIIVGTQALLQKDLEFKDLALVVVDEQHKFGVRQRQTIRSKELAPHYLVMTATPIPRTLAMTVFGDLDISTINHLPPGRSPIKTHWVKPEKLTGAYGFIREHVNQGEQVYFVYPRVAESEKDPENEETIFDGDSPGGNGQLKAAITEYEKLKNDIFPEFTVGLLHGQMDAQQKQQTMDDFRRHKIDILVATVVIEVGVDVPNATIMVIEHAEQFGLAQLHQLRGRIGRGKKQSFCFLFGEAKTEEAVRRLEMMVKSNDGFRIAEEDLAIRGPGEFFGTSQHGLPDLKIANLIRDIDLLRMAQREAFALAKQDPRLKAKENQQLRKELIKQFGKDMLLVDVG
ncbi:MAG: ATP-dependent DNA helicase RecG, partial [Phycisphaerae bacterium]|nr:ATP-dependent DNA helicase RecG [Phycisphaerae bacterium]